MTCQSGRCTRHGLYHVTVYLEDDVLERNYCRTHLNMLVAGIESLMDSSEQLHQYVDVEYAMDNLLDSVNV